jgi:Domain of unknown function (DUF4861)
MTKYKYRSALFLLGTLVLFSSFKPKKETSIVIVVKNTLSINRVDEIVSIQLNELKKLTESYQDLVVKDGNGKYIVTQIVDTNLDGTADELLFQANIAAKSEVYYQVLLDKDATKLKPASLYTTYARFVPERTDDFTWENDIVAFRTYGPEAQRLVEVGAKGGTLSSGIDVWLKKTKHSIIDKWYANNLTTPGYYHIDHGEGYDPYHVGKSRGAGGTGIWLKDSLHVSKNFVKYRVVAKGPLRAIFELDYNSWSSFGVQETKRISLDLGSNFTKFENTISADSAIPNYTLGITLHTEKGSVKLNANDGIFRHWEPIDDAFVGEGIIVNASEVQEAINHHSNVPDQSQVLVITQPKNNRLVYYVGSTWTKAGFIKSADEWDVLLEKQSKLINNPLLIQLK